MPHHGAEQEAGATLVHRMGRGIAAIAASLGRASVRAAGLAMLLVVLAVLPAAAAGGSTDLTSASVSPTTGTTDTVVTFSVTYHSAKGSPPDYVRVVVGTSTFAMEKTAGSESWKQGVRYTTSHQLPAGTWTVRFESAEGHQASSLDGGTVTITPAPTPKPTPAPTPRPTPRPTPAPTQASSPTTPPPTTSPSPEPVSVPTVPHGAAPLDDPVGWPAGIPAPVPTPSPSPAPGAVLPGAPGTSGTGGSGGSAGSGGPQGGGAAGGFGPYGSPASLPGSGSIAAAVARAMPTVVVTTGGVTMLMAFLAFGRRKRDEEQPAPDDVLGSLAGRGLGMPGHSGLVPARAANAVAVSEAVQALAQAPVAPPEDAHLPRWRRPSLMEARKSDPLRSVSTSVRLSFDGEIEAAVSGMERRLIRYRLVSLLDAPDEVRGTEIGVLDEGDEVVLLEKRGTYWRVLCPDGREGWLHKMTLGDVVIESAVASTTSWTSGDQGPAGNGGFEDILRAYMERREQFGEAS